MKTVTGFKAISEALLKGKKLKLSYWDSSYFNLIDDKILDEEGRYYEPEYQTEHQIIEDEPELYYHWITESMDIVQMATKDDIIEDFPSEECHIIVSMPAFDAQGNEYTFNKETKKWERFE